MNLNWKIHLLTLTVVLGVGVAVFLSLYSLARDELLSAIDGKLTAGANGAAEILGETFMERAIGPDGIGEDEYDRLTQRLSHFARRSDLDYVYTMIEYRGAVVYTSCSYTKKEKETGEEVGYFETYEDPSDRLKSVLERGGDTFFEVRWEEEDQKTMRSILMPMTTASGVRYVAGCDIDDLEKVKAMESQFKEQAVMYVLLFVLLSYGVVYFFVDRMISRPLNRLVEASDKLASGDMDAALPPHTSNDEIGRLTGAFARMRDSLSGYMRNLATSAAEEQKRESENNVVRKIRSDVFPSTENPFPEHPEFDIYAAMAPAPEFGGDFFNFFLTPDDNHLYFYAGSIPGGRGVPAALLMAITTTLAKKVADPGVSPRAILSNVGAELGEGQRVSMFFGMLNIHTGEVRYANGGHPPSLLVRNGHGAPVGEGEGTAMLGRGEEEISFASGRFVMEPGSLLLLYTPGIVNACSPAGEPFSAERLAKQARDLEAESAREAVDLLFGSLERYIGERAPEEEGSILALRYRSNNLDLLNISPS